VNDDTIFAKNVSARKPPLNHEMQNEVGYAVIVLQSSS
jgi:hypothetical protein